MNMLQLIFHHIKYVITYLLPQSALLVVQDEQGEKMVKVGERRIQCVPEKMPQSHNRHIATDCGMYGTCMKQRRLP